jgi:hypothetical protein
MIFVEFLAIYENYGKMFNKFLIVTLNGKRRLVVGSQPKHSFMWSNDFFFFFFLNGISDFH